MSNEAEPVHGSPFAALREVDPSWDYRGVYTKQYTHGLHAYPAMMIPQIARRLIAAYSRPGDAVLDPFCGSGSVLVEARILGRHSVGLDLNPLALLVARVKTTPLEREDLCAAYRRVLRRAGKLAEGALPPPRFHNAGYWFKEPVARQLAEIKLSIDSLSARGEEALRDFFRVAFSETARLSSNSRSREFKLYRYSPDALEKHNPDAWAIFREKVERGIERMVEYAAACGREGAVSCRTYLLDSRRAWTVVPEGSVDLVVTSPPYGDSQTTVAYGQFSRLSAQWLGFDDLAIRRLDRDLLGGRAAPTLENLPRSASLEEVVGRLVQIDLRRARQVVAFYKDLAEVLAQVSRAVRKGGRACVVCGNRRVRRVQLPTDLIIAEMAADVGLNPEGIWIRQIPSKTMPLQNSPTNIAGERELTMHQEYVVVLRKD